MLNALRENLKKRAWPKWLMLMVAGSMTLYLASYFGSGDSDSPTADGNWAAKVDGQAIPAQNYLQLARRIDQTYRQMFGSNYNQMRGQFQIGTQAMRQMLEQEIILLDARRLGLSVSENELIEAIRTAPSLVDPDGNFIGKQEYEDRLEQFYPGGVSAFEREMADEILIEKWTDLVSQTVTANDADIEALFRQQNEKTVMDYVVVAASDQEIPSSIETADVEQWYNDHADDFLRDAGRRIRFVTINRQGALDAIEIGEDAVQSAYQASQAKYAHPEQRRARHVLFRVDADATEELREATRQKAEEVIVRLSGGEEFAALATELSEDTFSGSRGGDLDWFDRGDMVGPFDEAAFGMASGDAPVIVETQFGFHVLEVTDSREAGARPLDEVREEIITELRLSRAEERMISDARRIRDRMNAPEEFDTVANDEGLTIDSRFVNENEGLADIGASTEFRTAVLEMEVGEIGPPLRVSNGLAVVVIDELVPEVVAPLDEVESRVRTALLNARALEAAISEAQNAADLYQSITEMAEFLGEDVQDSGDLAPGQAVPGSGGGSAEIKQAIFGDSVQVGDRGVIEVPAGALVYQVTRREPFDPVAFDEAREGLRDQLIEQRRLGMRRSMVDQLSQNLEIVVNDQLVERIDGGA